ncbi:hypothetical protein ACX80L_09130 [Arthrobacter sp. MDT1-48-3]
MDSWKSAGRLRERMLWSTLSWVGLVLTVTLATSIALGAGGTGAVESRWFYLQQIVLLAFSAGGTLAAVRRWWSFRNGA